MLKKSYQIYYKDPEQGVIAIPGLWTDKREDSLAMYDQVTQMPDFDGKDLSLVETSFRLIKGKDLSVM